MRGYCGIVVYSLFLGILGIQDFRAHSPHVLCFFSRWFRGIGGEGEG